MDTEETIKRVRTGDTTALSMLIQTYSPIVRKVCFNITNGDEDILNDLVQVVFIRAYYSLNQLVETDFSLFRCLVRLFPLYHIIPT